MSEVKVPEGYKQTEVGVIPEDWEVVSLGDAVEFLDGQRRPIKYSERTKISGIYPYYGASGIVDHVNDYIFDEELILLGEDGENILSRNLPLAFKVTGKIWVNNHAHVMRPNDNFNITFLTDFLESLDYSLLNSGSAQPKLNKASCLKIKVVKPSKQEQTAIATALSDVDNLIQSLEKLIAKKEAIKTGTMQQLLTGKTRLPKFATREDGSPKGFKQTELGQIPEDWKMFKFNENFVIFAGGDAPRDSLSKIKTESNPYPIFANAIQNKGLYGYTSYKRAKPDSITITARGYLGHAEYRDKYFFPIVRLLVLEPIGSLDPKYTTFAINSLVEFSIESTGVPQLTAPQVGKYSVIAPMDKKEQTAIATILSDMDAEIQALQERLEKTKDIKQGMMQQLLTGKVRLAH